MRILLMFLIASVSFAPRTHITTSLATEISKADWSEIFISKILPGIGLTILHYTKERGREYPPIEEDVTYWCIKPNQSNISQAFLNDSNIDEKLDFSKPISFLTHGWLSGLLDRNMHLLGFDETPHEYDGWMRKTAIDWAHYADCNVCVVDWSRLSNYFYNIAASKHTRMVSDALIEFMHLLIEKGMDIEQVAIAGHSLGAHIAGFVGQHFNGTIKEIYGLDPAGPSFTVPSDYGIDERLDPTDAKYVQCIYTSRNTLGTATDCGHGNFIMNGGITQPGCGKNILCSHSRAQEYFSESIDPTMKYEGEHCEYMIKFYFYQFLKKSCSDQVDRLGIHSQRSKGRFFVSTNSELPFARTIWSEEENKWSI